MMPDSKDCELTATIAVSSDAPLSAEVMLLARQLQRRYGDAALAVLAYGSCLRGVGVDDTLVDLYVLVTGYREAHSGRLESFANRLVPPNVYYFEHLDGARTLRSKYAVVSLEQFEHRVCKRTSNPYFWARFAQPCVLAYVRNSETKFRVHAALATAARTAYCHARRLEPRTADCGRLWTSLFAATYRTELRPEGASRAASIAHVGRQHFERITSILDADRAIIAGKPVHAPSWFSRRIAGKTLSVIRLVKAGFTFRGGAEYLAWKISRHSGVPIEVTPWQRRHPILAAIVLAPRLYRKGGFR